MELIWGASQEFLGVKGSKIGDLEMQDLLIREAHETLNMDEFSAVW